MKTLEPPGLAASARRDNGSLWWPSNSGGREAPLSVRSVGGAFIILTFKTILNICDVIL